MSTATAAPEYFFIIGAMKAGTTSLYHYLAGHPEIYASPKKEPRVFRDAGNPDRQRLELLSLFEGRTDERWCFEASTAYAKHPSVSEVPRRIHDVAPEARFLYLVRNPVDRAWSHYVHNVSEGRERRPFERAIDESREYVDVSRYAMQLEQFHEVFPQDRILTLVFDEMLSDPAATVRTVCEFLDISTSYRPEDANTAYNASNGKLAASLPLRMLQTLGLRQRVPWRIRHWAKNRGEALPQKKEMLTLRIREHLVEILAEDVERFFDILGRDVSAWTEFSGPRSPAAGQPIG